MADSMRVCFLLSVCVCTRQRTQQCGQLVLAQFQHANLAALRAFSGGNGRGFKKMGVGSGAVQRRPGEAARRRYWWSLVLRIADVVVCVIFEGGKARPALPVCM